MGLDNNFTRRPAVGYVDELLTKRRTGFYNYVRKDTNRRPSACGLELTPSDGRGTSFNKFPILAVRSLFVGSCFSLELGWLQGFCPALSIVRVRVEHEGGVT